MYTYIHTHICTAIVKKVVHVRFIHKYKYTYHVFYQDTLLTSFARRNFTLTTSIIMADL